MKLTTVTHYQVYVTCDIFKVMGSNFKGQGDRQYFSRMHFPSGAKPIDSSSAVCHQRLSIFSFFTYYLLSFCSHYLYYRWI